MWSDEATSTLAINPPPNQPPTAIIDSITPDPAEQGEDIVSFSGHGTDSDGSVVAYNWRSSIDGQLSTSASFTKPASELSMGMHTIYFKVQDDDGAWSDEVSEDLTINPAVNQPPTANFLYSPENPFVNGTTIFDASNSTDPDGNITNYEWNFGDGNTTTTTESIITHSYASERDYTVSLTVTDNDGATNLTSKTIPITLLRGDINRDGLVTSADACIALYLTVRGEYDITADVSGDGCVTSLDALMILQSCAGAVEL